LGDFGKAEIDSPKMRPFQGIHRGIGLESVRGETSKSMSPE